ncbi:MAG: S8 family serine peptidase [Steroidobacteraceae bacterium]
MGGIGEGQSCIDVETGWNRLHTRLAHLVPPRRGTLLCGRHRAGGVAHGTCVLGIICGTNPIIAPGQVGCAGIAPGVAEMRLASYVSEAEPPTDVLPVPADNPATDVAENIYAAVSHGIDFLRTSGGGVLLIEYQTADLLPLEILPAMRELIESAKPDVTVVEAAGNGNRNLDGVQDDLGNFSLLRGEGAPDSGAIMVGSAVSAVFRARHDRFVQNLLSGSNFGSRVDCYAWGQGIGTPAAGGAGDLCDVFGGTSGAAAIIAGVALVVRGIAANGGTQLDAQALRDLLRDENLGTRCKADARIGSMPDLARILVSGDFGVPPQPR